MPLHSFGGPLAEFFSEEDDFVLLLSEWKKHLNFKKRFEKLCGYGNNDVPKNIFNERCSRVSIPNPTPVEQQSTLQLNTTSEGTMDLG